MSITITAYDRSPDRRFGLARDTRVRWALEEVGLEYDVRGVSMTSKFEEPYLQRNPFGLIPAYDDGDVELFESGAIVLHIAEQHDGLLPTDPAARTRAIMWMFASLATVEQPIIELQNVKFAPGEQAFAAERTPLVQARIRAKLEQLAKHLGASDWLEGEFTAGDLMMVHVLLRLRPSGLLDEFPSLAAYVARGEDRPAYRRAFEAQRVFNNPETAPVD